MIEHRDRRFLELDRLIAFGQGSVKRNGFPLQTVECVSCGTQVTKHLAEIDPNEPQYCQRCLGCLKSEANLALGGRPRRPDYESPEVRRRLYLQSKAQAGLPPNGNANRERRIMTVKWSNTACGRSR